MPRFHFPRRWQFASLAISGGLALLLAACRGVHVQPAANETVTYQLPVTGPLPQTYRVTLAATDPKNPDWIVATFVAGGVRTVTAENQGRFTETWNGLDDNGLPVPPGTYGVKGIFMPAHEWKMDGQPHTLTAKYLFGAGDSWNPTPQQADRVSWIFGHCFGGLNDIQVGPNGVAVFLFNYIENAWNPFLADLNRPIGYDQVLQRFDSGGTGGGPTVACDGQHLWFVGAESQPFLYRAGGGWGPAQNQYNVQGVQLPVASPSMVAWLDPVRSNSFLHVALPAPVGKVVTYDGVTGAVLGEVPISDPLAIMVDRGQPGRRLVALAKDGSGSWSLRAIPLEHGIPRGEWSVLFPLTGIKEPADCEMDSHGNFYVSEPAANQVVKFDAHGQRVLTIGHTQAPGAYDPQALMSPTKLATWTDAQGADRVLVIEHGGPARTSEWRADGQRLRQWFFPQPGMNGYCLDPDHPQHIYIVGVYGGLVRFKVDYEHATWAPDEVWPDIIQAGVYPRIYKLNGQRYLTFAGGAQADLTFMIYREEGGNWVRSAGIVRRGQTSYWWHDANGDGVIQDSEFTGVSTQLRPQYWADHWLSDLSLVNFLSSGTWQRLAPAGFDAHGNPIYQDGDWRPFLTDPVYAGQKSGKLDALHGANEILAIGNNWIHLDGNVQDGFYVADAFGPNNPGGVDTAGSYFCQNKLTRYVPDGHGGYAAKWRVGRKAWRLSNPGEIYGSHHFTGETEGLVGIFDSNGLYHVFTADGMYVDTLLMDAFRYGIPKGGMYAFSGESWFGAHYLNRQNGKVYLFTGRSAATVYEVEGWQAGVARPIRTITPQVTLTAGQIAPANEYALAARGGAGTAKVAKILPAAGGGPAIDGSLVGWESASAITFGLDDSRHVEARVLYDPDTLYLRYQVRLPAAFTPQPLGDPTRLFTHERLSDYVSFYYQGNPAAAASRDDGRPDDLRIVFAIVKDGAAVKPVALGMYPRWTQTGPANPVTYISPTGKTVFGHVGLIASAKLAYTIDSDGKGFAIAAAIPRAAIPSRGPFTGGTRTTADFSATLGGKTTFWWANTGGVNIALTTDEPSEARLYPGAWAQAQFADITKLPIRNWSLIGPFGFAKAPQIEILSGRPEIVRTLQATRYPPEQQLDLAATYTGDLAQTRADRRTLRWQTVNITGEWLDVAKALNWLVANDEGTTYALTYVHASQPTTVKLVLLQNNGHNGVSGWLNDQPLPVTGNISTASTTGLDTTRPVELKAGWNKILLRLDVIWGRPQLGLLLDAPPTVLWGLRFASQPGSEQ